MFDNEQDWEEEDQEIPNLFPFKLDEAGLCDKLSKLVRQLLIRAEPYEVMKLSKLLLALERLPYSTPGVHIQLGLILRATDEMNYTSVLLSDDEFRLDSGGYVHTPGVG